MPLAMVTMVWHELLPIAMGTVLAAFWESSLLPTRRLGTYVLSAVSQGTSRLAFLVSPLFLPLALSRDYIIAC